MNQIDPINLGKKIITEIQNYGIDQSELCIIESRNIFIEIEKNSIKYAKEIHDHGLSIRLFKDGCLGFSYTTIITPESISQIIKKAVELAKIGLKDPDFKTLPHPKKLPKIYGTYDSQIDNLEVTDAAELISGLIDYANIDKRIHSINSSLICSYEQICIINSLGIEAIEEGKNGHTFINISAEITAKENQDMSSGFEFQSGRYLKEINIGKIGRDAAQLALDSLGARKIETCELPVIFHPIAAQNVLLPAIGDAINAESIQYGRNYLNDKLNHKIAVKDFEVVDNGIFRDNEIAGLGTSSFDGEGTPRQITEIIKNGILKNYLHDSYTAAKSNIDSTGNAYRGGFRRPPAISPTNLIIKPGSGKLDNLITETKDGILVIWTGDHPNLATGEFSGLIGTGFRIKNGEIAFPLKQTMLGINMLDFFQRIDGIGNDSRQFFHLFTPSIRISKARIGGK